MLNELKSKNFFNDYNDREIFFYRKTFSKTLFKTGFAFFCG